MICCKENEEKNLNQSMLALEEHRRVICFSDFTRDFVVSLCWGVGGGLGGKKRFYIIFWLYLDCFKQHP